MEAGSKQPQDRAVSGQQTQERERQNQIISTASTRLCTSVTVRGGHAVPPNPGPATRLGNSFLANAPQSAHPSGCSQTRPGS